MLMKIVHWLNCFLWYMFYTWLMSIHWRTMLFNKENTDLDLDPFLESPRVFCNGLKPLCSETSVRQGK